MKIKLFGILGISIITLGSFITQNNDGKIIFQFKKGVNISDWRILNDVVMGGESSASIKVNEDGKGVFQGKVSTKNNGGFASVIYNSPLEINNSKSILIRLKGDGKSYQLRVKKQALDFKSYITSFRTTTEWQTIEVNLSDLYPSFRGRKLDQPNFEGSKIEEISFLISNNKDESFKLVLDNIQLK